MLLACTDDMCCDTVKQSTENVTVLLISQQRLPGCGMQYTQHKLFELYEAELPWTQAV